MQIKINLKPRRDSIEFGFHYIEDMHLCSSGHFLLLLIERCQTDFSKIKQFNWHLRILLDKSFQLNALQPLSSSGAHSPTALEWVCDDCSEGVISINRLGLITPLLPTNRLIKCFTSSERPLASVSADDASTQPQQQTAAFALTHSCRLVNSLRALPGNDKLRQVWEY